MGGRGGRLVDGGIGIVFLCFRVLFSFSFLVLFFFFYMYLA